LTKWAKSKPNKDTIWTIKKDGMKKSTSSEQQGILELLED